MDENPGGEMSQQLIFLCLFSRVAIDDKIPILIGLEFILFEEELISFSLEGETES